MSRDLESNHSSADGFSQLSALSSFLQKVKIAIYFHCKVAVSFPDGMFCLNDGKNDNSYLNVFLLQMHLYASTISRVL